MAKLAKLAMLSKDERTVYVFALRYALPRHTYALSLVAGEILARLDSFEDWEIDNMIRDCKIYYPSLDFGGDMDKQTADKFSGRLIDELKRRGRDDLLSRLEDEAGEKRVDGMSLDKAIEHHKERRKQYHGAKAVDKSCRNHGGCPYCEAGRKHKYLRQMPVEDLEHEQAD